MALRQACIVHSSFPRWFDRRTIMLGGCHMCCCRLCCGSQLRGTSCTTPCPRREQHPAQLQCIPQSTPVANRHVSCGRLRAELRLNDPARLRHAGDLTYADTFDQDVQPQGSPDSGSAASGAKWDAWGRLTSSLFAQVRQSVCVKVS